MNVYVDTFLHNNVQRDTIVIHLLFRIIKGLEYFLWHIIIHNLFHSTICDLRNYSDIMTEVQ